MCQACNTHHVSDVSDVIDDSPEGRLRAAWTRFVAPETELFDRVVTRHRERHRRYHRLEHVDCVVRHVIDLAADSGLASHDLGLAVTAAMYHDAVYEPRSSSNERASARLARRDLSTLAWPHAQVDAVAAIIEGTADHCEPPDTATATLFDADLAVLGSDPDGYESYRVAIRQEYHHVDDDGWASGRADVLRKFLERTTIYATENGRHRWEAAARRNLADELDSLLA